MSNDNYYNNKGQQDRSDGEYNPPSNWEDKEAYDLAWETTKAQQDQAENDYNPPGNSFPFGRTEKEWKEKEAYDKSWDDAKKNEK